MSAQEDNSRTYSFSLSTTLLTTTPNDYGFINANRTDMTFTGIDLKRIVGAPVWRKAIAFKIVCTSMYHGRVGAFPNQGDVPSRSAVALLTGLPFVGGTVTRNPALTNAMIWSVFKWNAGSAQTGFNNFSQCFWKDDPLVNLRYRYVRPSDYAPPVFDNQILLSTGGYGLILPQQIITFTLEPIYQL
jgi:hypothetical protein